MPTRSLAYALHRRHPMSFHNIVVAVDFTDASRAAARAAITLLRPKLGRVKLVHVVPEPMVGMVAVEPIALPPTVVERLDRHQTEEANQKLESLAAELAEPGFTIDIAVRRGLFEDELLSYAMLAHADLIMVGAHEPSGPGDLGFHSRAESLFRRAQCPVLAFPTPSPDGPERPGIRRAVVGIDYSRFTVPLIRAAADLVTAEGSIELVFAFQGDKTEGVNVDMSGATTALGANQRSAEARALETLATELDLGVEVTCFVADGAPGHALLERAAAIGADLIAVGATDGAQPEIELGVPEWLIRQTEIPVMALPASALVDLD